MPQKCRVCSHPQTKKIEEEIVRGRPHTQIADRYDIHFQSVRYHAQHHLPDKLVNAFEEKEETHAGNILDGINDLLTRTKNILDQAEGNDQKRLALDAIREARSTYELLSKIAVKLEEYRRKDEEMESSIIGHQASEGLKELSDAELNTLVQLLAKVRAADSDYELDPASRYVVDVMGVFETPYFDSSDSEFTPNREREHKNSQKMGSDDLNDWSDDDLEIDPLDLTIPSDESDPDWLVKERRRRAR